MNAAQGSNIPSKGVNLEKSLDVTFADVAPLIGLGPSQSDEDIPTYTPGSLPLTYLRLGDIVREFDSLRNQYGNPRGHFTIEARSRVISAVYNRILSFFRGIYKHEVKSRSGLFGRVEHTFRCYGVYTVLFLEVHLVFENSAERQDALAKLIAKIFCCHSENLARGCPNPIAAILRTDDHWEFFMFDDSAANPLSMALHRPQYGLRRFTLPDPGDVINRVFVRSLSYLCEILFHIFMQGYIVGLKTYIKQAREEDIHEGTILGSEKALQLAEEAMEAGKNRLPGREQDAADQINYAMERSVYCANYRWRHPVTPGLFFAYQDTLLLTHQQLDEAHRKEETKTRFCQGLMPRFDGWPFAQPE